MNDIEYLPPAVVTLPTHTVRKHDIVSLKELDDAVYQVQQYALKRGMIPIAGVISRPLERERHEILGFGHNELADGVPGVHGETGAVKGMGRIEVGYSDLVATSSLSPCPFCQCTLARQLGIRTVRILDDVNYRPDKTDYEKAGITPVVSPHPFIEKTFGDWVSDPNNAVLWNRDIGIATGPTAAPRRFTPDEIRVLLERATRLAHEGLAQGEIPLGALIVDDLGQVVGSSFSRIVTDNDPSKVAAMAAWRAAGSRDDWGRHTLVLTSGPDHIAYSMFKIFGFGQLIVGSGAVYSGQTDAVRQLGKSVVVADEAELCDPLLLKWLRENSVRRAKEYFGADWKGLN
jgi:tRNA(Arg) A34 adenosine deaminase TadA